MLVGVDPVMRSTFDFDLSTGVDVLALFGLALFGLTRLLDAPCLISGGRAANIVAACVNKNKARIKNLIDFFIGFRFSY